MQGLVSESQWKGPEDTQAHGSLKKVEENSLAAQSLELHTFITKSLSSVAGWWTFKIPQAARNTPPPTHTHTKSWESPPLFLAGESLCKKSRTDFLLEPCQETDSTFADHLLTEAKSSVTPSLVRMPLGGTARGDVRTPGSAGNWPSLWGAEHQRGNRAQQSLPKRVLNTR